ncbi:MAG: hypothetical protein ACRCX2_28375 [Paraclostridium sp.]
MLEYNHISYGELVKFFRSCVGSTLPIYNGLMITKPPKEAERIEFRLINFSSTGQIYQNRDTTGSGYIVSTVSEYRCQLVIRVFADPKNCSVATNRIAGAIQTFEYLSGIVDYIYVKNETMRIKPFTLQKDNVVINYMEIIVDCYIPITYENTVDYFNRIEDVDYEIKE